MALLLPFHSSLLQYDISKHSYLSKITEWYWQSKIAAVYRLNIGGSNPDLAEEDYEQDGFVPDSSTDNNVSNIQLAESSRVQVGSSYSLDASAGPDIKVISQPRGVSLDDSKYLGYYFESTAGQHTMVYVIDTGAQIEHEVSFNPVL